MPPSDIQCIASLASLFEGHWCYTSIVKINTIITVVFIVNVTCFQSELRSTLLKLDEVDNMIDDVVGSVQQLECDILAIDVRPDDPQCLKAKVDHMQV